MNGGSIGQRRQPLRKAQQVGQRRLAAKNEYARSGAFFKNGGASPAQLRANLAAVIAPRADPHTHHGLLGGVPREQPYAWRVHFYKVPIQISKHLRYVREGVFIGGKYLQSML